MSLNLIDAAKGLFDSQLVGAASDYLGESETSISKAVSGIVPTILSGLISKTATHEGTATVAKMVDEQHNAGVLNNLGSFFGNDGGSLLNKGAGLLNGLFGHKLDNIISLISNFSGIKSSSSASLLSMALPAVLGLIGKHSNGNGASAVSNLLSGQKDNVTTAFPSGLNVSSVLGNWSGSVSNVVAGTKHTINNAVEEGVQKTNNSMRILLPLFLLVAAGLLLLYFSKGCNKGSDVVADDTDSLRSKATQTAGDANNPVVSAAGKLDSLTGDWYYDNGEMGTIDLPNNAGKLEVGKNSTEYKLVNFLNDKNAVLDTVKGNWFEFTNVHFKTGGAEITDESMAQLKNMVLIAKAFPNAKFKFGGYTDNTGSDAINIPLSQKRADAVAAMVEKLGASKTSVDGAKGYGSEHPLQPNDTKEGQAQNRRVAVNVKAK